MEELFEFLKQHEISFKKYDHPAIFTCEEAAILAKDIPGFATKNLFLRSKNKENLILVTLPEYKRLDIKAFAEQNNFTKLSFANAELLKECLNVEPGSVTLMGLIYDKNKQLTVFIDVDVWMAEEVQCHPLVNTATLVIPNADLMRFLKVTGHTPSIKNFSKSE